MLDEHARYRLSRALSGLAALCQREGARGLDLVSAEDIGCLVEILADEARRLEHSPVRRAI